MKKWIFAAAGIAAVVVGIALVSFLDGDADKDAVSGATMDRYRENEIQEYQGMRLDPAIGPRDNSIKGVQQVDIESYTLSVSGFVGEPVSFDYDRVLALPAYQRQITLHCVEGWDATILWTGILISDLLKEAEVKAGANTVIFHCVDGYTTSLPLSTIMEKQLLLAYQANGLPLPAEMGYPFIVVAEDKYGYKWARWVTELEVTVDDSYQGFWEKRGYSNDADISE